MNFINNENKYSKKYLLDVKGKSSSIQKANCRQSTKQNTSILKKTKWIKSNIATRSFQSRNSPLPERITKLQSCFLHLTQRRIHVMTLMASAFKYSESNKKGVISESYMNIFFTTTKSPLKTGGCLYNTRKQPVRRQIKSSADRG